MLNKPTFFQAWLPPALLCIFCWGLWGFLVKVVSDSSSPPQQQVLFTLGMLPLALFMVIRLGRRLDVDKAGVLYGLLNGVFTGLGLLAFYAAMQRGKAAVVGPTTGLFPMLTVVLAFVILRERLNKVQLAGVVLAITAIVILSI
jgi:uncharacterized membrane protein